MSAHVKRRQFPLETADTELRMCHQQQGHTPSNSQMAPEPRADSRGLPAPAASAPLPFWEACFSVFPWYSKPTADCGTKTRGTGIGQVTMMTHLNSRTQKTKFSVMLVLGRCVCPRMSIQRPEEDVGGLLYHSQPCSLDTGSLMESRVRLAVNKSSNPPAPPTPHPNTEPGLCGCAVIQPQVLKLAQ